MAIEVVPDPRDRRLLLVVVDDGWVFHLAINGLVSRAETLSLCCRAVMNVTAGVLACGDCGVKTGKSAAVLHWSARLLRALTAISTLTFTEWLEANAESELHVGALAAAVVASDVDSSLRAYLNFDGEWDQDLESADWA